MPQQRLVRPPHCPHSRVRLAACLGVIRIRLKQFDRLSARRESASLDGAPDVDALDHGFAVPIPEYVEHSPCEQIDLFPARRCHFTIYQPLSGAKRVGRQGARDGFREQSMFLGPGLDRRLRLRNLGSPGRWTLGRTGSCTPTRRRYGPAKAAAPC